MQRTNTLSTLAVLAAVACGPGNTKDSELPEDCTAGFTPDLAVLGTSLNYDSSAVDLVDTHCAGVQSSITVASGDAVIRSRRGPGALILNRGPTGNVTVLSSVFAVEQQVALADCNPQDVLELDDDRILITCYDDASLRFVAANGDITSGPSLAAYADNDGNPEMAALYRRGDDIFVALQKLDRPAGYTPTGTSAILQLRLQSSGSITVIQEFPLPCQNPFTHFAGDAHAAYIGCAGDFSTLGSGGVARFEFANRVAELAESDTSLGGRPAALAASSSGRIFVLIDQPGPTGFTTERMVLRELGEVDELFESAGYTLAGLAATRSRLWLGKRSADAEAGLFGVSIADDGILRLNTTLPPISLVALP